MKTWLSLLTTAVVLAVAADLASSQDIRRPAVSPYLNLLRRDGSGGISGLNYHTLVKPEFAIRGAISQIDQNVRTNQRGISELENAEALPATGHRSGFQTHTSYFLNTGGRASSGPRTAPVGGATLPRPRGR